MTPSHDGKPHTEGQLNSRPLKAGAGNGLVQCRSDRNAITRVIAHCRRQAPFCRCLAYAAAKSTSRIHAADKSAPSYSPRRRRRDCVRFARRGSPPTAETPCSAGPRFSHAIRRCVRRPGRRGSGGTVNSSRRVSKYVRASADARSIFTRGQSEPARKWRPRRKPWICGTEPSSAVAVITPMPGICSRRCAIGCVRATAASWRSSIATCCSKT